MTEFDQLLDATIVHLEQLKEEGVSHLPISSTLLEQLQASREMLRERSPVLRSMIDSSMREGQELGKANQVCAGPPCWPPKQAQPPSEFFMQRAQPAPPPSDPARPDPVRPDPDMTRT